MNYIHPFSQLYVIFPSRFNYLDLSWYAPNFSQYMIFIYPPVIWSNPVHIPSIFYQKIPPFLRSAALDHIQTRAAGEAAAAVAQMVPLERNGGWYKPDILQLYIYILEMSIYSGFSH